MNKAPAAAKRYAVFYVNAVGRREDIESLFKKEATPLLSIQDFQKNYEYVGSFASIGLDALFTSLQDGRSGLGHQEGESQAEAVAASVMQELVIRKVGHTSMYKGDVAVDLATGEVSICAPMGWNKITIVGMRVPVVA